MQVQKDNIDERQYWANRLLTKIQPLIKQHVFLEDAVEMD